jgi:hypothetical protein
MGPTGPSGGPPGPSGRTGPTGPSPFPSDLIVKWGRQTVTPNSSGDITVSFGYTFATPPTVNVTIEKNKPEYSFTTSIHNVTTTSFTYRSFFAIPGAPSNLYLLVFTTADPNSHTVNWIAYGK